ncbi:hypothetical protein NL489_28215, partial [Klebsiella pneumoniae]|nr:hypothetical protein [Klebsiella pneumoniae]
MAAFGVGNIVFIDKTINNFQYSNILKENARKLCLNNEYYFQHDNNTKHTAHIVKLWVLYNTPHTLKTPLQSPNLNSV